MKGARSGVFGFSDEREDERPKKWASTMRLRDGSIVCRESQPACRRSASGQWRTPKASNKSRAMNFETFNVHTSSYHNWVVSHRSGPSPSTTVDHVDAESGPTPGIYTGICCLNHSPLPLLKRSVADSGPRGVTRVRKRRQYKSLLLTQTRSLPNSHPYPS